MPPAPPGLTLGEVSYHISWIVPGKRRSEERAGRPRGDLQWRSSERADLTRQWLRVAADDLDALESLDAARDVPAFVLARLPTDVHP